MKLARPDVFHPRIVLAGCPRRAGGDADDAGLVTALRRRGLQARWLSWDDPEIAGAHLVILRATHDYADRLDEFLAWTTGVANLLNPPAVVAWNADRRYVTDLTDRGVPTVPGEVVAPGERARLPRHGDVFVGPTVGTGTRRFGERSAAAAYIAGAKHSVFVQAADSAPDTVLIFLGGKPSHAFPPEPDFELWDVGAAALAAAAADPAELLCARVHLSGNRVVDLQLVDPSLGWRRLDADTRDLAQREFALAVESACERLGLGPLSHRGP
ncbi:hypothetical protein [Mycobacterium conspicuum]|jgi:hypothetical protein|uniref:Uncharacterized protein n=1 Tax=Mycobacterium conspicuum TaxID=44010 RepID=A0A1X1TDC0_9MYCO|nr:hypothetical protein [Mycobacterium conspicuum]ORV42554.1 hypothetical protein AWC00_11325 [Mycobacterium conspicuum]BBZ39101.1 hypothetical protein MCNS_21640 [Mycobacterium conspicuum]